MIRVRQTGLEEAIAKTTRLRNLLGSGCVVRLEIDDAEVAKLAWQAAQDRNVTNLSTGEKQEIREIVTDHINRARSGGALNASSGAGVAMYRALGEWMRSVIADKIEDRRSVYKRPLSGATGATPSRRSVPVGYARWKAAHYGAKPILVLTGAMLRAVRNAGVRVERKG